MSNVRLSDSKSPVFIHHWDKSGQVSLRTLDGKFTVYYPDPHSEKIIRCDTKKRSAPTINVSWINLDHAVASIKRSKKNNS